MEWEVRTTFLLCASYCLLPTFLLPTFPQEKKEARCLTSYFLLPTFLLPTFTQEKKEAAGSKIGSFGDAVLTAARELVPSDLMVDLDTTLMDVGLDSLAAAAFIGTMHALIHIQLPPPPLPHLVQA